MEEAVECCICLQAFEEEGEHVPRVLSCGHSLCESCIVTMVGLDKLDFSSPAFLVRCPECTHITRSASVRSLPRNIELLRLANRRCRRTSTKAVANGKASEVGGRGFFVLENICLFSGTSIKECAVTGVHADPPGLFYGNLQFSSAAGSTCYSVSLVDLGKSSCFDGSVFTKGSYAAAGLHIWQCLSEDCKKELIGLSKLVSVCSRVCRVLGLWLGEDKRLYLVNGPLASSEPPQDMFQINEEPGHECYTEFRRKVDTGLQICEILMELHSNGMCCGVFGEEIFTQDGFGRLYFHWNGAWRLRRIMRQRTVLETMSWQYISPEVLIGMYEPGDDQPEVGSWSDTWSLAWLLLRLFFKLNVPLLSLEQAYEQVLERKARAQEQFEGAAMWQQVEEMVRLKELLLKCISYKPEERGNIQDVWQLLKRIAFCSFHCGCPVSDSIWLPKVEPKLCFGLYGVSALAEPEKTDPLPGKPMGTLLRTMRGHTGIVSCLAACGPFLVSASYDKTVRVWGLEDGAVVHTWRDHHPRRIQAAVADPSLQVCFTGDDGGIICAWSIREPFDTKPDRLWQEHRDWRYSGVWALALSFDGVLYSGSGDRTIKAWCAKRYELLATLRGHSSVVSALAVDGGLLYSGSWDGSIRIWLRADHTPTSVLHSDAGLAIRNLSVVHGNGVVIASLDNGSVLVWRNAKLSGSREVREPANESIISAMTLEDDFLITGSRQCIKVWPVDGILVDTPVITISVDDPALESSGSSAVQSLIVNKRLLFAALSNEIHTFSFS